MLKGDGSYMKLNKIPFAFPMLITPLFIKKKEKNNLTPLNTCMNYIVYAYTPIVLLKKKIQS